jgi:hypothetical protein
MRGTTLASRPAAAETAALAAIDGALTTAARRTVFSRDEADTMFHGVCVAVLEPARCAAVRSALDEALPAGGAELVERSQVVDVLLDARLLVASPG